MGRPKRLRRINQIPRLRGFKPIGNTDFQSDEKEVILFEEYEALRLSVYEKMPQDVAAKEMNVSRPTFTRILNKCFEKISNAFIEGKTIVIDGGQFEFSEKVKCCNQCGSPGQLGMHDCRSGKSNSKTDTFTIKGLYNKDSKVCYCPECDYEIVQNQGVPCCDSICPNCKLPLMRHKFK